MVYFGLKHSSDFGELLLGEFPKPCGEKAEPYHLNGLCGGLQAQVLPCDVVLLSNMRNNNVPYPTP
jgi:hypothetical protein